MKRIIAAILGTVLTGLAATVALLISAAMGVVALMEVLVPLHPRGHWNRAHLKPNLALTLLTFATNTFLNAGLLMLVMWLESRDFGLSAGSH